MAPERLAGVDVARCVALFGMGTVHVLPTTDAAGAPTLVEQVFGGRSAALFAVLAGVGLALAVGPHPELRRAAPVVATRAALIGAIGLLLAVFDSGVAVILAYYAVLFVLVLPWLRARPPVLLASAAVVAVGMPFLSFAVRDSLPPRDPTNPGPWDLAAPGELLSELLLTGYYPAAVWVAYLLTGMAVARIGLRSRRNAAVVAACGAALALAAHAASALLLGPLGGYRRIGEVLGLREADARQVVDAGAYGNVPTDVRWWLATDAPHSTTPLDVLATTGSSLLVLGLALLAARAVPALLAPFAAVGSMPLSLYTAHVVLLGTTEPADPVPYYWLQVAAALVFATLWRRFVGRGPLESAVARAVEPLRDRPVAAPT
jgi:uncharacterized membrane protein YeiB